MLVFGLQYCYNEKEIKAGDDLTAVNNAITEEDKMGVDSKYHRFREAGQEANINNVERFGQPVKSLFTTSKVFTLHHHIDVTDGYENVVYSADTKFLTLHDRTQLKDAAGNVVADISRKFLSLHERHFVDMADGTHFELSNELFHIYHDITNIQGLGWQLRGNMFGLNFELYEEAGGIIAVIGQKFISMHDKYCMDIYRPEYEKEVVAILITLQHMIRDRSNSSSGASSRPSSVRATTRLRRTTALSTCGGGKKFPGATEKRPATCETSASFTV